MELLCIKAVLIFVIGYLGSTFAFKSAPVDCSECGASPPPTFTIVKGNKIKDTRTLPWLASVRRFPEENFCGGVILDEYFILTAAHCVERDDGHLSYHMKVHFQTKSVSHMSEGIAIEKIIIHPKFKIIRSKTTDVKIAQYDIALLKLKEKIKCDPYKRPICLPRPYSKIPIGKEIIIAGWGQPAPYTEQKKVLEYAALKHLEFEECIKAVPEANMIKDHNICLGGTKHSACYGDSGGPSIAKIDSKYTVIGIASSETNLQCSPKTPLIYTDVAKFVYWIKTHQKAFPVPESFPQDRQHAIPQKNLQRERIYKQAKNRKFSIKKGERPIIGRKRSCIRYMF